MFSSFMNKPDGSMTFDWIFMAIVVIPMIFAVWELVKANKSLESIRRNKATR